MNKAARAVLILGSIAGAALILSRAMQRRPVAAALAATTAPPMPAVALPPAQSHDAPLPVVRPAVGQSALDIVRNPYETMRGELPAPSVFDYVGDTLGNARDSVLNIFTGSSDTDTSTLPGLARNPYETMRGEVRAPSFFDRISDFFFK